MTQEEGRGARGTEAEASLPSRNRASLSVATIATDEADRLPRTLAAVSWADEIVVVDGGSSDGTPEVAREHGARVVHNPFPGYAEQKRRALREARGPWVLLLDADEEVTPELAAEIRDLLRRAGGTGEQTPDGYEVRFHTRYLGHWLGWRGWHREWHLRLVRKEAARVLERRIHEGLAVEGRVGRLEGTIRHYSYRDVADHLRKVQEFSELKAEELHRRGRRVSLAGAVGHAVARFLSGFLLRGRLLDGWPGLVYDLLGAHSTLLAYLKLWERGREADR